MSFVLKGVRRFKRYAKIAFHQQRCFQCLCSTYKTSYPIFQHFLICHNWWYRNHNEKLAQYSNPSPVQKSNTTSTPSPAKKKNIPYHTKRLLLWVCAKMCHWNKMTGCLKKVEMVYQTSCSITYWNLYFNWLHKRSAGKKQPKPQYITLYNWSFFLTSGILLLSLFLT